jgi:hypothetical protein
MRHSIIGVSSSGIAGMNAGIRSTSRFSDGHLSSGAEPEMHGELLILAVWHDSPAIMELSQFW